MKLRVSHFTHYAYSEPVSFSPHLIYLRPRETPQQRLHTFSLNISPTAKVFPIRDAHDNTLSWAHFPESARELMIHAAFEVESLVSNPFDFVLETEAVRFPFTYRPADHFALAPYLAPPFAETRAALGRWLDENFANRPAETVPMVTALNQLIFSTLTYRRREEHGIQPSAVTLQLGSGSCRDFAVLLAEFCRMLGIAARFVSGYLYAPPDDDQRSYGAMHAWTEVFLPGAGWRALDPTHGIFCHDAFIPVAHAAEAESVNPVQGRLYGPRPVSAQLQTTVLVEPIN